MELIHYVDNGRQLLDVREPRHYETIRSRTALTDSITQEFPWTAIAGIRMGDLPIGQVASVMYAVMKRSPIVAEALARSVADSKGYAEGYPEFQCPRDWLSEAADIVSPEFLAAKSWTLSEEVEQCNWWADKPNTISLMSPPEVAAAVLKSVDETAAGRLAMLIDIHRDEPEFARRVAACIDRDWPAFLTGAPGRGYPGEALALADSHGFLPGTYAVPGDYLPEYWHEFAKWACTHPGVYVKTAPVRAMLYNGSPLTDTAQAIRAAFENAVGY